MDNLFFPKGLIKCHVTDSYVINMNGILTILLLEKAAREKKISMIFY
jgi:hypothetical protein